MKMTVFGFMLFSLVANAAPQSYTGSNFNNVWDQVSSDAYDLPQNRISVRSLYKYFESKIAKAANRTLNDRSDILPQFQKLAHPNGICLKGQWEITRENPYGGYFKKGSVGMIIARASTAMSTTKKGEVRAFGLAGKIFPTDSSDHGGRLKTANFFLVDDLGGTKAEHYTDVEMTNEPRTSVTSQVLLNIAYALKLAATFGKADQNPGMRQVYEISELGKSVVQNVLTPKWMKASAVKGQTVDEDDFRDELNIKNYNGKLVFNISVASNETDGKKNWKKIGTISFTDSVVSNSCDHRLHFHHPKWKSNLKH